MPIMKGNTMNLNDMMLCEINPRENDKYHIIKLSVGEVKQNGIENRKMVGRNQ